MIFLKDIETSDWGPPHKRNLEKSPAPRVNEKRFNSPSTHYRPNFEDPQKRTSIRGITLGNPITDSLTEYYIKNVDFPSSPVTVASHSHEYPHENQPQHPPSYDQLVLHSEELNQEQASRMGKQRHGDYPPLERDIHREAYQMSRQRYGKYPPLIQKPTNYWGTYPLDPAEPSESSHED